MDVSHISDLQAVLALGGIYAVVLIPMTIISMITNRDDQSQPALTIVEGDQAA